MNIQGALKEIVDRVRRAHPGADVGVRQVGGVHWLDARLDGATVVLEVRGEREIGVSTVERGDTSFGGHDEAFQSFKDASNYLLEKLNEIFSRRVPRTDARGRPAGPASGERSIRSRTDTSGSIAAQHDDGGEDDEDDADDGGDAG